MKPRDLRRFFLNSLLIPCCFILTGCSTSHPTRVQGPSSEFTDYWEPYLLYLLASPHPRLYVEMDVVDGSAPSDGTVEKLRAFLAAYCQKPDGVEIVRGAVIPKSAARGVGPEALARKYMVGPPNSPANPQPAFMCVLFYDSFLCDEAAVAETREPAMKPLPRHRPRARNPVTDVLPYPIVYMNARYGPKSLRDIALLHETGHMLGLAHRTNYASSFHCLGPTCLMNKSIHLSRLFLGFQKRLCKRCLAELAGDSRRPPPSNLRFVGSVLVRSESGYNVLCLPRRVKLVLGQLAEGDCQDFANEMRAEAASSTNEGLVAWKVKEEVERDPAKKRSLLNQIEVNDPYDPVRFAASRACWSPNGAERDFAYDPATNVVQLCRQSILLHPEDGWSYNQLAWVEATSSNRSARDGKQAVAHATKACELSDWKNSDWIDTLAAACAESGDFDRAIELEEQALRTGNPRGADQKDMQYRMALYKQSRPFREKQ